ncbi:MAG: 4-alpha-glucanotransferase [bacterium]|nr:4-alpha-glucanotransferase [bacterium]
MTRAAAGPAPAVADALRLLDVDTLLLAVPDRCFPSRPDEDTGVGTSGSHGAADFLARVRRLGFTGIQLGPQGETSDVNASPYDGTLFSRSRMGVAPGWLVAVGLLEPQVVDALVAQRPRAAPDRLAYAYARRAHGAALDLAWAALGARAAAGDARARAVHAEVDAFARTHASWLERDALYEALQAAHAGASWRAWPDAERDLWLDLPEAAAHRAVLRRTHAATVARWAFGQWAAAAQHAALRVRLAELGMRVWGDMQVGPSEHDAWAYRALFLSGYALGAPPSRTTPEGQPWGYPVLDPGRPEAVAAFVAARAERMFADYDGVRIDHPQGLVCPWVYRPDAGDVHAAVRAGARLRDAPDLPDHPSLARFAIARREQLTRDPAVPRWADDWVTELEPAQVERYAWLALELTAAAHRHGRGADALACEVLSTCPYPLRRVLERLGLGRFRVTQKARLDDPTDVYRAEHAAPADWVMVGTHDTPPIWRRAPQWTDVRERAAYLAWRLAPDPGAQAALAADLAAHPTRLVSAHFADLFASRAQHVLVFFADAFGLAEVYNTPGTTAAENWSLRLPSDWAARLRRRLGDDAALNLPASLALAVRARHPAATALAAALDVEAAAWRAGAF